MGPCLSINRHPQRDTTLTTTTDLEPTSTTQTGELLLEATGVVKTYGAVRALFGASLAVRPGEVHALMGANGAGKSTMVKILTGAIRPTSGHIADPRASRGRHTPRPTRGEAASFRSTRSRRLSRTWMSART